MLTSKKASQHETLLFCAICCLVYFASYFTRTNYGAAMAEIVVSEGVKKTLAGMAVTGSFITYGAGQIVSGMIGDRIRPKVMIFVGLMMTCACNLAMSFLPNMAAMTAVWCVNGFAQSMLWPSLVRHMIENLSAEWYKKACVAVSVSASAATIAVYLFVPLCITLSGWRAVFLFSALFGLAVALLWLVFAGRPLEPGHPGAPRGNQTSAVPAAKNGGFRLAGLVPVMLTIVPMGILRDGITTWLPSYIHDTFRLGTSLSILSATALPVITLISLPLASRVHRRMGNELRAAAAIWAVGLACALVLPFSYATQMLPSVALMAILTGCMHGVNLMLIGMLPARYGGCGRIATVSGILNACTYLGSAISTYGVAAMTERWGWSATVAGWCAVALAGTVLNLLCVRRESVLAPVASSPAHAESTGLPSSEQAQ